MDERAIIIADRDAGFSSQATDHFKKAGYRVETADSVLRLIDCALENRACVLLLGNDFDKKFSSADLIRLLRQCNSQLRVIMVCDGMPMAQARRVRQEGIFYYSLKPATAGDTEELGMAVACAFENHRESRAPAVLAPQMPAPASCEVAATVEPYEPVKISFKALPWVIGLVALVFGASYLSLVAAGGVKQGSSMAIWIFLGFCALIITTQLLPIFRIKLPISVHDKHLSKQESASTKGK
jgi:ActR/RegA family two-component response regulator